MADSLGTNTKEKTRMELVFLGLTKLLGKAGVAMPFLQVERKERAAKGFT